MWDSLLVTHIILAEKPPMQLGKVSRICVRLVFWSHSISQARWYTLWQEEHFLPPGLFTEFHLSAKQALLWGLCLEAKQWQPDQFYRNESQQLPEGYTARPAQGAELPKAGQWAKPLTVPTETLRTNRPIWDHQRTKPRSTLNFHLPNILQTPPMKKAEKSRKYLVSKQFYILQPPLLPSRPTILVKDHFFLLHFSFG